MRTKKIARLICVAALAALGWRGTAYAETVRMTDQIGATYDEQFVITVANLNEPPTDISISRTDVDENQEAGRVIEQFMAVDPDGGTHTFALVAGAGGEDNGSFTIHALSGILMTSAVFDFETKNVYHILVRATDQGGLSFDKAFTIAVNDVNEPPIARNDTAVATEDSDSIDVPVLANDEDPEGAQLMILWPPIVCVQIIGFDCPIDYRPPANFCGTDYLSYTVTDGPNQASATVAVAVSCVPDDPTDITLSASSIQENRPAGTTVGTLATSDPDAGNTFTYSLVPGAGDADNASFQVAGNALQAKSALDFEAQSSFGVRLRTTGVQDGLSFEKAFTITVTNVNETPTDLVLSSAAVDENRAAGTAVGDFSTSDPDAGGTFTYALVAGTGGTDNASFTLSAGGTLKTAAVFDFEGKASYGIRVRTTDQGGLPYDEVFTIVVTNVNEAPADLTLSGGSVAENQPAGTVVGSLAAPDPDGEIPTLSLAPGAGDTDNISFEIIGSSLRTRVSFNHEEQNAVSVRVRAEDSGGLASEKVFSVAVTNVNEAPTSLSLDPMTIAEGQPAGTVVGTLSTTDPDGGEAFVYAFAPGGGDGDNGSFTIANGQLRTGIVFDLEAKASYSIRVRTTDQGGAGIPLEREFTVAVTDVNEPPSGLAISATAIDENSPADTTVGTVSVTDPDSETPVLSFVQGDGGADNAAFELAGSALRIKATPDYEAKSAYAVRLKATDAGGLSVEEAFSITVNDLNEPPTALMLSKSTVAEGGAIGTVVGALSATDPDAGESFTFAKAAGAGDADNGDFEVVGAELRTAAVFDRSIRDSFSIRLKVTDKGDLPFERQLTITVTQNQAPTDIQLEPAAIAENAAPGTAVGTLAAADPDGDSGVLFALVDGVGGEDNGSFVVDGVTLRSVQPFDFEAKSAYSVLVRATDPGGKSFEEALPITVANVNDAPTIGPPPARQATAGIALSFPVPVADQDGDALFCAMTSGPPGALFDQNTCAFRWTPAMAQVGAWQADFLALDDGLPAERTDASTAIVVAPPLFFDDFTHGTGRGDRDWIERRGNWSVDGRKRFVSTATLRNLAHARGAATAAFATGRISAKVTLGQGLNPNATIVFGYRRSGTTYSWRSVTVGKNRIVIGEQGRALSTKVTRLAAKRRYAVTLDLLPDGRLNVSVNGVQRHTYKFAAPAAGRIGLAADLAKSYFDDVTVWDASMVNP